MMPHKIITMILLLFFSSISQASWLDSFTFREEECINLFKKTYHINAHINAIDIEKIETDKYEFTPVMVVRGDESFLTRQYCEYYPEEKMLYIGTAKSVVDLRHKKALERQRKKAITDKKKLEAANLAAKHAAEIQVIADRAAAEAHRAVEKRKAEIKKIKGVAAKEAAKLALIEKRKKKELEDKIRHEKLVKRKARFLAFIKSLDPHCITSEVKKYKNSGRIKKINVTNIQYLYNASAGFENRGKHKLTLLLTFVGGGQYTGKAYCKAANEYRNFETICYVGECTKYKTFHIE